MITQKQKSRVNLTVSLEPEVAEKIREFAENEDRSVNNYVVRIFKNHIAEKVTVNQQEAA